LSQHARGVVFVPTFHDLAARETEDADPRYGNTVAVTRIGAFRFSGGKVVESWDEYEAFGMLRQLRASPLPEQAGD